MLFLRLRDILPARAYFISSALNVSVIRHVTTAQNKSDEIYCRAKVSQGLLEGRVCTTFYGKQFFSFEGVPYAKPPTGELRFKGPQEPENWSGTRNATVPGNKSLQLDFTKDNIDGSEDCLYLNIYTPSLPVNKLEKLPVIVFIHGGNLNVGYGHYYKPDYLIKHNVILVTINYRLHIFGFLCLNTPEVPGNAGLKDTVMALKWVQSNIEEFNGDKDNVTLMGESVGACIATSYLTTKMGNGLFHKIICHSGNFLNNAYVREEDEVQKAIKMLSYLNNQVYDKRDIYNEFKNMDVNTLLHVVKLAYSKRPRSIFHSIFEAVVEQKFENVESFFEESPYYSMKNNRFKKVPMLVTLTSHEGALFTINDGRNVKFEKNLEYFVPYHLRKQKIDLKEIASKIRSHYFTNDVTTLEYVNMLTDHSIARDTITFLNFISKVYKNVYFCRFGYEGNLNIKIMKRLGLRGATHGDLIQYIFYNENKHDNCNKQDVEVVDFLSEACANFAKTSVPSATSQAVDWSPYNNRENLCLNIDNKGLRMERYPEIDRLKLWYDLNKN